MVMEDFLGFVITGHMDHGKSTLIGRLLYDTDSLPEGKLDEVKKTCEMLGRPLEFAYVVDHLREERENEMTIDTAQMFFKSGSRSYVIIDAPGHKEFMKNMLTGASQADAAVLIVDTNEGMQEQTQRHAYALSLLGLQQVVVVLNKMDKAGYSKEKFEKVKDEAIAFLSRIGITASHYIPISAANGDNVVNRSDKLGWYCGPILLEALAKFAPRKSLREKPLRFPVQDVYKADGKSIAVGRVESGELKPGEVSVLPGNRKIKISKLEAFGKAPAKVEAGLNSGFIAEGLSRGDVVCSGAPPHSGKRLEGSVFWLAGEPLKKGERLSIRIATEDADATVEKITNRINSSTLEVLANDADRLEGMEAGDVLFSTEKSIVYDLFGEIPTMGRFVLVRHGIVEGGGIITKVMD